jgi:hypothetical protein
MLEEFLGGRLYTGPTFEKYNTTLRGGALNMPQPVFMQEKFEKLCAHNRYPTTIHAICSAITKMGKLTKAATVFRGFSGGVLPDEFMRENHLGVKGAVECAFMSTTLDWAVAQTYAGTGVAVIMQLDMGMVDRGADLSELSQYPTEKEVCFGPLTSLQVMSTHVHGPAMLVKVRPNINLSNTTLDKVLSKRRELVISMCSSLGRDCASFLGSGLWRSILQGALFSVFKHLDVADPVKVAALSAGQVEASRSGAILAAIQAAVTKKLEAIYCGCPAERFNDDGFFKERIAEALAVKEMVRLASGTSAGRPEIPGSVPAGFASRIGP